MMFRCVFLSSLSYIYRISLLIVSLRTGQSAYVFEYLQWLGYDEKSIVYLYHKRFDSDSEKDSDSINGVIYYFYL